VSRIFTLAALRFAAENPLHTARLLLRKTLLFWGPAEIGHDREDQVERAFSASSVACRWTQPVAVALFLIGLAMLAVESRTARRRRRPRPRGAAFEFSILALLFVLAYFASFLPFFVTTQFRVPLLPFLLLFGAEALFRLGRMVAQKAYNDAGTCSSAAWWSMPWSRPTSRTSGRMRRNGLSRRAWPMPGSA